MKYKYILGLDIGTNSLGWSFIKEFEDGHIEIVKTGIHTFPIGTIVDDKNNKEKTKNEQRRSYRGASRNRYRFKIRRNNLKEILDDLGMLPNFGKYHKAKGKGQSYEMYKLRADAINPGIETPLDEIGRIFMLLNKYRGFKSNAKKLGTKDKETGVVKKGYEELQDFINNHNCKTIGQYFFKMHQLGTQLYKEGKWHNPNEPIDERAFDDDGNLILFNSNGIRRHYGRYTLRDMYLNEFDKIWEAQKNHHQKIFTGSKKEYDEISKLSHSERINALKVFKKTNFWKIRDYCIYYQRPLKSQKKYVSNCQFERGDYEIQKYNVKENAIEKIKEKKIWKKKAKKACHRSHPLYQEFRIWQKLHQIFYSSTEEDVFQKPLKQEWLKPLADALMINYDIYLNKTPKLEKENKLWFGKILKEQSLIFNDANYTFYIDKVDEDVVHDEKNVNRINGNVTYASFADALGLQEFNRIKKQTISREENKNTDEKVNVQETKLQHLWHTLYIAKDGLFKEDEWLKSILTEPTKWNFTDEQATKLIENGLLPDYGSYSLKVLKAILPEMRKGLNEHQALKIIDKGYINEDNTIGAKVKLKDRISQLKYQELRNPVVEKSISKTIKLVNAILDKYGDNINKESLEIRIESTRQLKKPRSEREKERANNTKKDNLREQYAAFLNKNKAKIGVTRNIYKYDSLVNKYELWLEMNMNEDDELFQEEFQAFSKITKAEDKLKHKLWLECGRMCPYTPNRIINLTDLFSSNVEIEHIIPMSRSLDNSFNNKTITYRTSNALKGKMTPFEFAKKQGDGHLKWFKKHIKDGYNKFSDSKKKLFLSEDIESKFSNNQLTNTSYIAKFTKSKMKEVCKSKNVQFTNGRATSELRNYDWKLSDLLDKIRYEEATGINMDDVYSQYKIICKDFKYWYQKRYGTTDIDLAKINIKDSHDVNDYIKDTNNELIYFFDEIERFNSFRNKDGRKDRTDHRHHAIDAFIIACCSPKITQLLSTFFALKEDKNLEKRELVDKTFDFNELKKSIASILVSHSEKQSLIKKRINHIKAKNSIEQVTYAPQGKLHEESFYAKRNDKTIRRVKLFDPQAQEKTAFNAVENIEYKINGETKWHYIDDPELYKITKIRLEELGKNAFSKDEMEKKPFYRASPKYPNKKLSNKGKPLPVVKSVRKRFNTDRTLIHLPAKDEVGNIVNKNRFVDNNSNALLVVYEKNNYDSKGKFKKPSREFELISFFDYVDKKRKNEILFKDEKNNIGLKENLRWLVHGDFIAVYEDMAEKELFMNNPDLIPLDKIYKIKGLSADSRIINGKEYPYGYVTIISHRNAKDEKKLSHTKFEFIKIDISILGEISVIKKIYSI